MIQSTWRLQWLEAALCSVCLQIQRVLCSVVNLLAKQYSTVEEGLFVPVFPYCRAEGN